MWLNFSRSKVHFPGLEVCCGWTAFFTTSFSWHLLGRIVWGAKKKNLRWRLDRSFKLPNSPWPYYTREHSSNMLEIPNVCLWNKSSLWICCLTLYLITCPSLDEKDSITLKYMKPIRVVTNVFSENHAKKMSNLSWQKVADLQVFSMNVADISHAKI